MEINLIPWGKADAEVRRRGYREGEGKLKGKGEGIRSRGV